jgi:hypothetical protein
MVQLAEPDLEALRWLGANEGRFTEAWLEYYRPDAMFYILEYLGMPEYQLNMLQVSMLDAPLVGGGEAWDLISDKHFAQRIRDVRDGKLDWSQEDELSFRAGQVTGKALAEAWNNHEVARVWMIDRIHKVIPDLQSWIDKSKESE